MNESDILTRWKLEKKSYEAWGFFIIQTISNALDALIEPMPIDKFLKIPAYPRLKTDATLVDKALYRKKYQNPYDDLTDKVGIRFVVMLTSDIKKICDIIESGNENLWRYSKDRDFEEERKEKPLEFSYQSIHYVLCAKEGIKHNGMEIPAGTSCEVQIRTLLQHAHSELTHDTIYKPKSTDAKPEVRRTVARSMALIETTDEFFEQAMKNLEEASRAQRDLLKFLTATYEAEIGHKPGAEKSNQLFIETYLDLAPSAPFESMERYFARSGYIFSKIREQIGVRHFFSQPTVLLAYYLANSKPSQVESRWPMDQHDLAKIFSDMGKSFMK